MRKSKFSRNCLQYARLLAVSSENWVTAPRSRNQVFKSPECEQLADKIAGSLAKSKTYRARQQSLGAFLLPGSISARSHLMAATYLDFATCRCGYRTPVRPSKPATKEADQKWTETGGDLPFVACSKCKRIYKPQGLETGPSTDGLSPHHPNARLHVFHVSIECAEGLNCPPIEVIAVRNSDTSGEDLQKETARWKGKGLKCPRGHVQSFPSGWE